MDALMPWIDAIGWTLLHFLWQGAAIGVAYAAARSLLAREASDARYLLGLGALALLALTPLLTLARLWPAAADVAPAGAAWLDAPAASAAAAGIDLAALVGTLLPWLVAAWLLGVCVLAARALREWHRLDRILRRGAAAHARIDAMLAAIKQRLHFPHRVRALISAQVDTPMLVGWLRPVIVLPAAVALGFPRAHVELILAHELGHLRRRDHLVNLVQTAVETVLFYHPVVHWISREVRNERELCCDRLVLRTLDGEAHQYARMLAALEELRLATPMMLAANGGELLARVQRIVGVATPRVVAVEGRAAGRWLLLAGAMLALWAVVAHRPAEVLVAAAPAADWLVPQWSAPVHDVATAVAPPLPWRAARVAPDAAPVPPVVAAAPPATAVVRSASRLDEAAPVAVAARLAASTAALPVAAAPAAPSIVTPATPPADRLTPAPAAPVAVHTVAPAYPGSVLAARVSVEASFAIAPDGSVRDIHLHGAADRSFKRAAELALRQWRFDPASLGADSARRYSQTFVFAPAMELAGGDGCQRQTGSMLCRAAATEPDAGARASGI